MNITSLLFAAFCILTVAVYSILPHRARWCWLLLINLAFYLSAGVKEILYILMTALLSWIGCIWIAKTHRDEKSDLAAHRDELSKEEKKRRKQAWEGKRKDILAAMLAVMLGHWGILKYSGFFLSNVNVLLKKNYPLPEWAVPLGISFYTVFCIGYCIDVYRKQYDAEPNFLKHLTVVTFFPCITQGPIERYGHLSEQIFAEKKRDASAVLSGAELMLWGFFKKLVIADQLAVVADTVFADETGTYTGLYIWIAAVLYAVQIYADFSGYTDVVRGLCETMGISLAVNFKAPYFSRSVPEYWRRWHISLGAWFKDYVFYPVLRSGWCRKLEKQSGKRFSRAASNHIVTSAALAVNWALIGLWHGTHWKYIAHGLFFGAIMIVGIWVKPLYAYLIKWLRINTQCFSYRLFQTLRTSSIVCFSYILFCAKSCRVFLRLVRDMIQNWNPWIFFDGGIFTMGIDQKSAFVLTIAVGLLVAVDVSHVRGCHIRSWIAKQNLAFRWILLYGILFAILLFGAYGPGYQASDFIYQGF